MKIEDIDRQTVQITVSPKELHVLIVTGFLPLHQECVQAAQVMKDMKLQACEKPDCPDCQYRNLVLEMGNTIDIHMMEVAKKIVNEGNVSESLAKSIIKLVERRKEERNGR